MLVATNVTGWAALASTPSHSSLRNARILAFLGSILSAALSEDQYIHTMRCYATVVVVLQLKRTDIHPENSTDQMYIDFIFEEISSWKKNVLASLLYYV